DMESRLVMDSCDSLVRLLGPLWDDQWFLLFFYMCVVLHKESLAMLAKPFVEKSCLCLLITEVESPAGCPQSTQPIDVLFQVGFLVSFLDPVHHLPPFLQSDETKPSSTHSDLHLTIVLQLAYLFSFSSSNPE